MSADRSVIGIDHLTVVPRAVPATEDGEGTNAEDSPLRER